MKPTYTPMQAGFTMVELVVTMVVIGVMAIAIVPRMSLLQGFDEIGFRDQVKGALQYARKSAVAGRRDVRVTIESGRVFLERETAIPEDPPAGFSPLNLPGRNDNQIVARGGATLTSTQPTITFDPLGRLRGISGNVNIDVPGGGTITLVAETGYVY